MPFRSRLFVAAAALALAPTVAVAQAPLADAATGSAPDPQVKIRVPEGFKAHVFAKDLGCARHLAAAEDGTLYVAMRQRSCAGGEGGIAVVKDTDGNGTADWTRYAGEVEGSGVALYDGHLYFGEDHRVIRYALDDQGLPSGAPQTIVTGFPRQRSHASKPMAFSGDGRLFVTVGAPSNACQKRQRTPGSPGVEPCPQLQSQAGIWVYGADRTGQRHGAEGRRYATGIRNALALDWHPAADKLVFSSHGRDQLHALFKDHYSVEDSAELPGEEIHVADRRGQDFGWPYTYWDQRKGQRMQAPEYGGDGQTPARGDFVEPVAAMPGHWAPNDLVVYTHQAFPKAYRNGAFIAFHGSWNRAPLPQKGYNVVFVPMDAAARVTGSPIVFADRFKGKDELRSPRNAAHRPMGLAVGPDGALYIADSVKGWIWKVTHEG